jgi:hypothetical protein
MGSKRNFVNEFSVLIEGKYALVEIKGRKFLVRPLYSLGKYGSEYEKLMKSVGDLVRAYDLIEEVSRFTERIVCNWLKGKSEGADLSKMPSILKHLHGDLDKTQWLIDTLQKRIDEIDARLIQYSGKEASKVQGLILELESERKELLKQRKELIDNA